MSAPNPFKGATTVGLRYRTKRGDVLDIFVEKGDSGWLDDQLAASRKKALTAGHTILNDDGSHEFISTDADYDENHNEIFHEDGDRIRCTRFLVRTHNGERTETKIRKVWIDFIRFYEGD